ncbi:MAG: 8-oxoguanine DNA glycosylase [Clostridia bacterium]|nr:8-oxoguanine DNA glycosylase [Clostridia bacterium]
MKEQTYKLDGEKSFELNHIFDCGQCFRWNIEEDGSYTGVIKNGVLNVKKEKNDIIFTGNLDGDIKKVVEDYFDLNTNYENLKNALSQIDTNMKNSIEYGYGIRILNQDLWECIISFIISANNNIPRIKGIIDRLSKKCGKKVIFNEKEYYLFPTPEAVSKLSVQDLRDLGLGFRDKRVYTTTKMIIEKQVDLDKIENMNNSEDIRNELLKLDGVGPKVADCIMLFSLKRFDVFPIDVWVRRVMNDLYIHNEDETKVDKKHINKVSNEMFGDIRGIAQQYLFYWRREN